jgi:DNA-binding NtrC family response regulator
MSGTNVRILVVDDESGQREILGEILRDAGHDVEVLEDPHRVLDRLRNSGADLLVTDLRMPSLDGHRLLKEARELRPDLLVILMTAYATVASAVEAMRDGAFDYLQKPFGKEELLHRVERAAERVRLARENRELKRVLGDEAQGRILGDSPAIAKLRAQLAKVAPIDVDVLLTGESGTGKELAARVLHFAGGRASGPFVPVNCAAIPESLAESELFGHAKGAFTNATESRAGRFEQADGGTLFLDEVVSMPLSLQSKLLRVLQDRVVERIGSGKPKAVDVRIVAASNRDLKAAVSAGDFRDDLYHRLNVVEIRLPPLRERAGDVLPLAETFAVRAAERVGLPAPEIGAELRDWLGAYPFPGNVRELEHLLERMVVLSEGDPLGLADLPPSVRAERPAASPEPGPWPGGAAPEDLLGEGTLSLPEVEERLLREAVRRAGGNLSEAARRLGISYKTMQYRARKFGLGDG